MSGKVQTGNLGHVSLFISDEMAKDALKSSRKKKPSAVGSFFCKAWEVAKPVRILTNTAFEATKEAILTPLTTPLTGIELLVAAPTYYFGSRAVEHGLQCSMLNATEQALFDDKATFFTKLFKNNAWSDLIYPSNWKDAFGSLATIHGEINAESVADYFFRYGQRASSSEIDTKIADALSKSFKMGGKNQSMKKHLQDLGKDEAEFVKYLKDSFFNVKAEDLKTKFGIEQTDTSRVKQWFKQNILDHFANAECLSSRGYTTLALYGAAAVVALISLRVAIKVAGKTYEDIKDKYFQKESQKVSEALSSVQERLEEIKEAANRQNEYLMVKAAQDEGFEEMEEEEEVKEAPSGKLSKEQAMAIAMEAAKRQLSAKS